MAGSRRRRLVLALLVAATVPAVLVPIFAFRSSSIAESRVDDWVEAVRLPPPAVAPVPKARPSRPPAGALVGLARTATVRVYASPDAATPRLRLSRLNGLGIVRSFLVKEQRGAWLRVLLPVRPNSSFGWIRSRAVFLRRAPYRLRIELARHRLSVLRGSNVLVQASLGAGMPEAPTPTGEFYVTDIVRLTDPSGPYGPFAIGLSAFSTVYDTWGSGPAQIAIHGTNDPASIGGNRSHGCIRIANDRIRRLAGLVQLGTPVTILQ